MNLLVSIGMSVFNGDKTLAMAIRSILNQTYSNWELIVIDDGSTDNSLTVANSFNDPRIKVFHDGLNKNLAARLNEAVDKSNGVYFARMDQDDISFPDRLEKQVAFLTANPEIDLVGASTVIFEGEGNIKGIVPVQTTHQMICRWPWNGFHIPHPTWLGQKSWFGKNRYRSSADRAEDQDLLFRSYRESRFACIDNVLLGYRQDDRPLKKLFLARVVIMKCFLAQSLKENRLLSFLLVVTLSPLKIVADALHQVTGVTFLRNKLLPADFDLQSSWKLLWESMKSI